MKKQKKIKPAPRRDVAYPRLDEGRCVDHSRRRFLRQLGAGAGAAGIVGTLGLPRLSHGQSREVDFTLLDAHPSRASLEPNPAPVEAPLAVMPAATAPAPPADAPAQPASPARAAVMLTENRALWIEPGYLILIRWMRPEGDAAPVGARLGSAVVV